MKPFPQLWAFAGMFAIAFGVPLGLYILLTRGRRRLMRDIQSGASARGWKFRRKRWQGDPTAFRIDGWSGGPPWVLNSGPSGGHDRGWSVRLGLRFPNLAGEVDVAVVPRDSRAPGTASMAQVLAPGTQARVASFSGTLASAIDFSRDAQELPTGLPEFDAAYRVLALPGRIQRPLLDGPLAARLLHWPAETIAPHAVLAWRDPFGFHVQARLPAPPNWATVAYLVAASDDLSQRLPAAVGASAPQGLVDRLVARFLGS